MITIGICDDDEQFIEQLYKVLYDIMLPICDWQARIYHSGNEVLEAITNNVFDCNLLFTDIFMENGDGLSVAKYICENRIDTDLIFISSSKDYVFECYHYHTFAYLLKPLSITDVGKEVTRYMQEISINTKCLNLSISSTTYKVPINTILYIESNRRKIIIHTKKRNYDYYEKLSVLEQTLQNDGFIRCHQSYLIPYNKLLAYNPDNTVSLEDIANNIPVSRRYQSMMKALFEEKSKPPVSDELALTDNPNCYLTSSLQCNRPETGAFICIKGAYVGAIIRIKPEQCIRIGRDGDVADMVINLPFVSRLHCEVIYHAEQHTYEIVDFSSNGTFVNGNKRLVSQEHYLLKPGTELCFGDKETVYKLG